MASRISTTQLHTLFLHDLGDEYVLHSDIEKKPLVFSSRRNANLVYKAYIYNCTNPPGGRQLDEFKIQLKLPGQREGDRGTLDESDGSVILLVGFANYDVEDNGVWIFWETKRHMSFAFNANLQVKMGMIIDTITKKYYHIKKRGNSETIVLSDRTHLPEALDLRDKIDLGLL